jgi:putative ABC transport system permease protein
MKLVLVGEALGLAAAFALQRVLKSQLYDTAALDPVILTFVPLILGATAFIAALIPARRAMQVDPLIALRRE